MTGYTSRFEFARDNPHFTAVCDTKDRALWLRKRKQYIGASDAAAIIGENPWASAMDVYADHLDLGPGDDAGEFAYWGEQLEPILLKELTRRTSRHCESWGELLVSKERPWQACTMDGLQETSTGALKIGGVEAKCTKLAWRWNEGIPPYVQAQIQHQYSVTGFELITLVVLFNGNEYYHKDIPRDEEYISFLNEKELLFWDRLNAFEPPDPDSSESCKKALARLFPRDNGETIQLPPEFTDLDARLVSLKEHHKDLTADIRGYESKIKAVIGDATSGICSDGTIYTHKAQTREAHNVAESTFRVLRRKGGKL